jgi:hypothetical protein
MPDTGRARHWLYLLLFSLAPPAPASEIQRLDVTRDGNRYRVELEVRLTTPAAASYTVFADPNNLPKINPSVLRIKVFEHPTPQQARLYTEVHVCAAFYCKTLRQVQQMHYISLTDGGEMQADVIPEESDFHYGTAAWSFHAAGAATQLHFRAELEPAFWIPPLIGPWLVERSLREEAQRTSSGIEALAAAPAPGGAAP